MTIASASWPTSANLLQDPPWAIWAAMTRRTPRSRCPPRREPWCPRRGTDRARYSRDGSRLRAPHCPRGEHGRCQYGAVRTGMSAQSMPVASIYARSVCDKYYSVMSAVGPSRPFSHARPFCYRVKCGRNILAVSISLMTQSGIMDHSGRPAFRKPSAYLAKSCRRRNGIISLRSETRSAGSSWRRRATAFWASSIRPASALLAAARRNAR